MNYAVADEVKTAALAAGITRVEVRPCSMCGYLMAYLIKGEELWYDPGCDCTTRDSYLEPRNWSDAADWINMQSQPKGKIAIAKKFGLELDINK